MQNKIKLNKFSEFDVPKRLIYFREEPDSAQVNESIPLFQSDIYLSLRF